MSNENTLQPRPQRMKPQQADVIDLKKIFFMVVFNWYYFLIALIVAFICAWFYISQTIHTYRVSATLLINEEKKENLLGNNQLLEGFGLAAGMINLDNQIMILSSRTLIGRTLDELDFYIE